MATINVRGKKISHEPVQSGFWKSVEQAQWEQHTFDVLDKHIKYGSSFVDIGAWNGVLSLYAASLGAVCYAVEPDPKAGEYLQENIRLNKEMAANIIPCKLAISSSTGTADLRSANGDFGNSMSSLLSQGEESKGKVGVDTVTLEKFFLDNIPDISSVSLVKIDIEGAEEMVIPDSAGFFMQHKPTVYLSLHPFWFEHPSESAEKIADVIFSVYSVMLNGVQEISRPEFIAEMGKMDGVDVLLLPKKERVGIVIPIYNRPEYLRRCFESLQKLTVKPDIIVLVDDASTDENVVHLIGEFAAKFSGTIAVRNPNNEGVKSALSRGIGICFSKTRQNGQNTGCDIVINLDSDAIVKPEFIEKILALHRKGKGIVSGFNCISLVNPIVYSEPGLVAKSLCNGINMCFNQQQYEEYIFPSLLDSGNWDYQTSLRHNNGGNKFLITSPSVVQHIGSISTMGHTDMDVAADFKPLVLRRVTLFGIDANNPEGIKRAAEISQQNIEFGDVVIITDRLFPGTTLQEGRENYSKFMIKNLDSYIHTSHVLTIHSDGYVINFHAWDPAWLNYDYIGGTWGYKDNKNVGNGGFSLRSKRLINVLAKDKDIVEFHPEDDKICRFYRSYLEQGYGIKFAPEEVANRFSIEAYGSHLFDSGGKKGNLYSGQFGFHSVHVDFSNAAEYGIDPQNLYKK